MEFVNYIRELSLTRNLYNLSAAISDFFLTVYIYLLKASLFTGTVDSNFDVLCLSSREVINVNIVQESLDTVLANIQYSDSFGVSYCF